MSVIVYINALKKSLVNREKSQRIKSEELGVTGYVNR